MLCFNRQKHETQIYISYGQYITGCDFPEYSTV